MTRTANCLAKLDRMKKALCHQEPDRVPVSDWFWSSFLKRWRKDLGLAADADIYRYYDLDWQTVNPNMDPHVRSFEVLRQDDEEVTVRTGFGATIRKRFDLPMPAYIEFETDTVEKMQAFQFEDPFDDRRYFAAGDDQINGVGDTFVRDLPAWRERVDSVWEDFPVFGSVCEASEMIWRILGSERVMYWIGDHPDEIARFVERIHEFSLGIVKAQIEAAAGHLDGMVIWGDVAYKKGMMFSPVYWRRHFKPVVKSLTDECHRNGLMVIYHGCGNVNRVFEDFIETGIDAYNPLEAKAGLDVVDLRQRFGHRIAFCGNMDVVLWASGSKEELKAAVLRKLNAAKGGGYLFQSDHSVPSNVSGENYDYVVNLVREYGRYPLQLGEHDIPEVT